VSQKKIAVLGTGANGSCIAADLANAGLDVVLIDQWPEHVEAMRAQGLDITLKNGDKIHAKVKAHHLCDLASLDTLFDIVFLVTKSYDTRWHAELIKPYLKDDGFLIGIQNAMTAEMIADVVGPSRTMGCVVELSSYFFIPAQIKRNTAPQKTWFGIGSFHPSTQGREAEVRDVLRHAGKVDIVEDVLAAKFMKLVVNSMTLSTMAMIGGDLAEAHPEGMKELMMKLGTESLAVSRAIGYPVVPIFGLSKEEVAASDNLLMKLVDKLNQDIGPGRGPNTTLQDHMKGRLSEVDMINGLIVEQGRRRGIPTPANEAMVEITRRIYRKILKPDTANMPLALELAGIEL
jgi:2-dehydropantoate 2-reductase